MSIQTFKENNFEETIVQGELVLVDFWAPWCGPCKMIAPILEQLDQQAAGKVTILKVNVDDHPDIASQYGIMSIPTLKLFKAGKAVETLVGVKPLETLIKLINQYD